MVSAVQNLRQPYILGAFNILPSLASIHAHLPFKWVRVCLQEIKSADNISCNFYDYLHYMLMGFLYFCHSFNRRGLYMV